MARRSGAVWGHGKVGQTMAGLIVLPGLGLAIGGFVSAVRELPYWAGTPGTASGITCVVVPTARSSETHCRGTFLGGMAALGIIDVVRRRLGRAATSSSWRTRGVLVATGPAAVAAVALLFAGSAIRP